MDRYTGMNVWRNICESGTTEVFKILITWTGILISISESQKSYKECGDFN